MRSNRLSLCRKCISTFLSATIITGLVSPAVAGDHSQRAEEYVRASHQRANAIAQSFVRDRILEAVKQVIVRLGVTPDISSILAEHVRELDRLKAELAMSDEDLMASSQTIARDIQTIADDFEKTLDAAERARLDALDAVVAARLNLSTSFEALTEIETQLVGLCQTGVAIDLDNPNIPSLQPFIPPLVLQAQATAGFGDNSLSAPQFSASASGSDLDPMKVTIVTATSAAIVYSAIAGTPVLSQSALAALTGPQLVAGFGVVSAIVASYVLIDHAMQMKKAFNEADDIRTATNTMVFQRATSEDVRRYSIEACRATLKPIQEARDWIGVIKTTNQAPDSFLLAEKKVMSAFSNLVAAQNNFAAASMPIQKRYLSLPPTSENRSALIKELQSLAEYQKLTRATDSITPETAGLLMQVAITRMVAGVDHQLSSISSKTRTDLVSVDWTPYRKRLANLRKAAFIASEASRLSFDAVVAETNRDLEIRKLYRDFDSVMITLIRSLFAAQKLSAQPDRLKADANLLFQNIKAFAEKRSDDPFADRFLGLAANLARLTEPQ